MARLGDEDASALASELCVSGGRVGLRAALRLQERLADESRILTREARLLLLEALAGATGGDLGVTFETTGRGLTFPGASVARPDPAWFQSLRASARRAWGGIDDDSGGSGGSGGGGLGMPPAVDRRTGSGNGSGG
ncbi:unnamed protein product, partial [Laminaria digitata]